MPARAYLSIHWLRAKFVGQPQGLSLRYAKTKKFAKITGGDGTPPLHDFIQADVGRKRLFLLQGKSRDSLRVGTRRKTTSGSRKQTDISYYLREFAVRRCAQKRQSQTELPFFLSSETEIIS